MATPKKIVKISVSDYELACKIAEAEGRTLGDSVSLVGLRRHQQEQSKNSPEKSAPVKKSVRLPSGRILELSQRG